MKCPECGTEASPDEKFCGNCGAPLPETEPLAEEPLAAEPLAAEPPLPPGEEKVTEAVPLPSEPEETELEPTFSPPITEPETTFTPPPPPPPEITSAGKTNKTLIIVIVVIVLLLLCCCCVVVVLPTVFGDTIQEVFDEIINELSMIDPATLPLI
jgi:hypothetical protein